MFVVKCLLILFSMFFLSSTSFAGSLIIGIPKNHGYSLTHDDIDSGSSVRKYSPDYIDGELRTIAERISPDGWSVICDSESECKNIIRVSSKTSLDWVSQLKKATSSLVNDNNLSITIKEKTKVIFVSKDKDVYLVRSWHISKDGTLKSTLKDWSEVVGYRLMYSVPSDWTTGLSIDVDGTFSDVVMHLVENFKSKGASVDVVINHKLRLVDVKRASSLYELK